MVRDYVEAVVDLPDKQSLSFWTIQGIINKRVFDFDSISEDKKYTVWLRKQCIFDIQTTLKLEQTQKIALPTNGNAI